MIVQYVSVACSKKNSHVHERYRYPSWLEHLFVEGFVKTSGEEHNRTFSTTVGPLLDDATEEPSPV